MTVISSFAIGVTDSTLVVRIHGHATREQSPGFVRTVSTLIDDSPGRRLVVDLELCEFLDSTFLGSLVVLYRRTRQQMSVCATDSQSERLFSSARIDRLIPVLRPDVVSLPKEWQDICVDEACNTTELVENVAVAHRCLADVEGPNAEIYRQVADQLDSELTKSRRPR